MDALIFQNGRYRSVGKLGEGGTARVWKVWDSTLHTNVAIKKPIGLFQEHQRFLREARVMASLTHPNILAIKDIFEENDCPHIVMEFCQGSIQDWINRHRKMPPSLVKEVSISVLKALAHAHQNSIVHRDIKPHNILFNELGIIKVADFGLARVGLGHTSITKSGAVFGTEAFMSPEQKFDSTKLDQRSDIYSMGITMAWMIHGGPILGDLHSPSVQESLLKEGYPKDILDICIRAAAYKPSLRYQNASQMLVALEECIYPEDPDSISLKDYVRRDRYETQLLQSLKSNDHQRVLNELSITEQLLAQTKKQHRNNQILVIVLGLVVTFFLVDNVGSLRGRDSTLSISETRKCTDLKRNSKKEVFKGGIDSVGGRFADLDLHGHLDAVFADKTTEALEIYFGDGQKVLNKPTRVYIERPNSPSAIGDVDSDGILDIVTPSRDRNLFNLIRGQGERQFSEVEIFHQDASPHHLQLIDWDRDGFLDLLFQTNDCTAFRKGQGNGQFDPLHCVISSSLSYTRFLDENGEHSLLVVSNDDVIHTVSYGQEPQLKTELSDWYQGHQGIPNIEDGFNLSNHGELYFQSEGNKAIHRIEDDQPCVMIEERRIEENVQDVWHKGNQSWILYSTGCEGCEHNHIVERWQ